MAQGFPMGQGVHPVLESEAHKCCQAGEETLLDLCFRSMVRLPGAGSMVRLGIGTKRPPPQGLCGHGIDGMVGCAPGWQPWSWREVDTTEMFGGQK